MRFLPASLALLGVEIAMAAVAAPQDASPTRPQSAHGIPQTRPIPEAGSAETAANAPRKDSEHIGQAESNLLYHQEAKRQQASMSSESGGVASVLSQSDVAFQTTPSGTSMTGSASSSGGVASVLSQSDVAYQTSTTTQTGPITTSVAYFTAGGGVYSVEALSGDINVVAGKTVTVGGPDALVGGVEVSAAPSGLIVDGGEVEFETVTISASVSSEVAMTSSGAPAGSISASASVSASEGAASASSSADFAMPKATAGAGMLAAVGAVVGMLVL